MLDITVESPTNATAPGKAAGLSTKDIGNTAITLEWSAPADTGKDAAGTGTASITGYRVIIRQAIQ